jgi:hypothetical protein
MFIQLSLPYLLIYYTWFLTKPNLKIINKSIKRNIKISKTKIFNSHMHYTGSTDAEKLSVLLSSVVLKSLCDLLFPCP